MSSSHPHSNSNASNSFLHAATNSQLKQLTATDTDNGENGKVSYSIIQSVVSDSMKLFAVDSDTGMVTLKTSLDREKAAEHVLFIKAQDNGNPQLSGKRGLVTWLTLYWIIITCESPV